MDVQGERRLAAGELAHRSVDLLMALARGHDHVVPDRGRMRSRDTGREAERGEHLAELVAQRGKLRDRAGHVRVDAGAKLHGEGVRLAALCSSWTR